LDHGPYIPHLGSREVEIGTTESGEIEYERLDGERIGD
jgi:hypothetical protein